jgi:hypothetical protein
MRYIITILLLIVGVTGCGRLAEKFSRSSSAQTTVHFSTPLERSGINPQVVLTNGLMIFAVNAQDSNRRASKYAVASTDQINWTLPNGTYHFYSVAYAAAGLQGTMYCARAENVNLNGTARNVEMTLSTTGQCGLPPFAPSGSYAVSVDQLQTLYGVSCSVGGDLNLVDGGANNCDSSLGRPPPAATTTLKIYYLEYDALDGRPFPMILGNQMGSICINQSMAGATTSTLNHKIPFGLPFVVEIRKFVAASCTGAENRYVFGRGLLEHNLQSVEHRNNSGVLINPANVATTFRFGANPTVYFQDF